MTSSKHLETSRPVHGDVLIVKDESEEGAFTLSVVPGPPQIRCQTHADAVSVASAWASRQHVAIWFTPDGHTFAPVSIAEESRVPRASSQPPETV